MRRVLLAFTTLALTLAAGLAAPAADDAKPINLLIITGDHGHDWKATTQALQDTLSAGGRIRPDVTTTPAKDLTAENLAKYDVLLLNYKDTPKGEPDTKWSDANKEAFLKAVKGGKGLVVYHHASSAFTKPNWEEFEKATAGGWRSQGFHGPKHEFVVKKTDEKHPISEGLPSQFNHVIDELYQNSLMVPGNVVLATAYSDPSQAEGDGQGRAGDLGEPVRQGAGLQQRPRPRHHGARRPAVEGMAAARGRVGRDRARWRTRRSGGCVPSPEKVAEAG